MASLKKVACVGTMLLSAGWILLNGASNLWIILAGMGILLAGVGAILWTLQVFPNRLIDAEHYSSVRAAFLHQGLLLHQRIRRWFVPDNYALPVVPAFSERFNWLLARIMPDQDPDLDYLLSDFGPHLTQSRWRDPYVPQYTHWQDAQDISVAPSFLMLDASRNGGSNEETALLNNISIVP